MKKVFSVMALAAMMLFAGQTYAQITIHAGYQSAKVDFKYIGNESNVTVGSTSQDYGGFYAGATYDYDLGLASLSVTPGLEFSYLKYSENGYEITQNDLRIRLWGRWDKHLNDEIVLGLFVGPSINIGIGGSMYDSTTNVKGFDLGLTFGAQIKYNNFGIEGGYNWGLLNRSKESDLSIKFHTLFIGANYAF